MQFSGVKNIVHTAAMVNDATIAATNAAGFENVLHPKVTCLMSDLVQCHHWKPWKNHVFQ